MEPTIPKLLRKNAADYAGQTAQMFKDKDENFQPVSFKELYSQVLQFAAGLKEIGVKRSDNVGLISDNRQEWFVTDLAVLSLGAADVPRGCDSTADEISYILSFSECRTAVLENVKQLDKILEKKKEIPELETVIIIDPEFSAKDVRNGKLVEVNIKDKIHFTVVPNGLRKKITVYRYREIMDKGQKSDYEEIVKEINKGEPDDNATIIYTSGTTGEPKGVMLTHRNFLHQVEHVPDLISVGPGDKWLCVLPVWHSFERIMQYVALGNINALCYSKPVGSILLEDMQKVKPTWMASVPRIWESVRDGVYKKVNSEGGATKALFLFFVAAGGAWRTSANMVKGLMPRFKKRSRILDFSAGIIPYILLWPLKALGSVLVFKNIRAKLGGNFVAGISGGGSLPAHVDKFFQAADITLLEGYGLTESGPVLSLRDQKHPVPGTIGPAFPGTELKILDENGNEVPPGETGVLYARGPQIMKGYYRKEELTKQAINEEGFLNTGDLAKKTWDGEFAIVGRAKDTIVLLGGENIEPAPIEDKLKESPYISRAVVVGQDRKYLGALIHLDMDNIKRWAQENNVPYRDDKSLIESAEVHIFLTEEISNLISAKNGFKIFERIVKFKVLPGEFELGKELSAKQEIKRHVIRKMYKKEIESLFNN